MSINAETENFVKYFRKNNTQHVGYDLWHDLINVWCKISNALTGDRLTAWSKKKRTALTLKTGFALNLFVSVKSWRRWRRSAIYAVNWMTIMFTYFWCVVTYTLCSKKGDAKIQITITMAHLIRINYPLGSFNYRLSGTNVANFNKIYHIVSEQQLFKNGTQKQNFPMWKILIRILTAGSVTNDIILVTFLWRFVWRKKQWFLLKRSEYWSMF